MKKVYLAIAALLLMTTSCSGNVADANLLFSPLTFTSASSVEPNSFEPTSTPSPEGAQVRESMQIIPSCARTGRNIQCTDDLLDIRFRYPVHWGGIEAVLHRGFRTGYGYDYIFPKVEQGDGRLIVNAGGRSSDYSEPRGGMFGDFRGFGGQTSQQFCEESLSDQYCEVIKPGVVFEVKFANAHILCEASWMLPFNPIGIVSVNLPHHNIINGLRFGTRVLSDEQERELFSILAMESDRHPRDCRQSAQDAYDLKVADLLTQMRVGSIDAVTAQNMEVLRQFAESIVGADIDE